ncbi:MAG: endonuclease [Flavobacteriaceae bacterium]|nr:endonuclease [Flavobacteriaceae bacterium]
MKKIITLIAFLSAVIGFSQELQKVSNINALPQPPGYYANATGSGFALKTQLKTIITNGHNDQGYGALWTLYTNAAFRDNYYENDNSLIDMYSENPTGPDPYNFTTTGQQCGSYANEGDCYNREHIVPQAYWDGVATNPMKNDPFHVAPVDGKVNGLRDNFPYGRVNSASTTTANGSKLGSNLNSGYSAGYSATVFEPVNEFKGDIARSIFYFATRYEDQMVSFYNSATVASKNMFDGSANNVFSPTFLNILITWHNLDPVSTKEIERNNVIYGFQGNRNPFIDHPEYVCQIWAAACAALSNPTLELASISVYPNPSNDHKINIDSDIAIDDIQLININGQLMMEIKKPIFNNNSYTLDNLPQGFYFLKLSSENQSLVKKVIIN